MAGKGKPGRKSLYRAAYAQTALDLCLLGYTDADLAKHFGVSVSAIGEWKTKFPAFGVALKTGKAEADGRVAASLYKRALGYQQKVIKIFYNARTNQVRTVKVIEEVQADTTAMIFWLKNRQPQHWRDRRDEGGLGGQAADVARELRDAVRSMWVATAGGEPPLDPPPLPDVPLESQPTPA